VWKTIGEIMTVAASWFLTCTLAFSVTPSVDPLTTAAVELEQQLRTLVMPYWYDSAVDQQHGGYILESGSKQLVAQTRMIWGFAHAHRQGLSTAQRDYLAAARQGYEFLVAHFLDSQHGGYYWMTDDAGTPINRNKMIYGQAFVIYALVEYARASEDQEPLERAGELFRVLQREAHDPRHGGWFEHFDADWTPVMQPRADVFVELPGYKSANSHLHLMEAFTQLYLDQPDAPVREALRESLRINCRYFYPRDAAQSAFHCFPDWRRVTDKRSEGLSYGHNVEFAWLMVRAQQALGEAPDWDHFHAHLDHALKNGFDHQTGGLFNLGVGDQPARDRGKVWWSQAEMLAALTVSIQHQRRAPDVAAMELLLQFLEKQMIDPRDGIWASSVTADGETQWHSKKNHWKANYHDVRAVLMFIDAFRAPG
jgi:mannobiose 2-epimerase